MTTLVITLRDHHRQLSFSSMGSVLSKRAASAALRKPASPPSATATRPSAGSSARTQPGERGGQRAVDASAGYHRPTRDEWAATLQRISGAISSSPWAGSAAPGSVVPGLAHPAQRSSRAAGRMPRRAEAPRAGKNAPRERGGLSQNQVLALFGLRRRDPDAWGPRRIADRFGVDHDDARDLLRFTRTYTGRLDEDGTVRAYYKADPENTIVRFERD